MSEERHPIEPWFDFPVSDRLAALLSAICAAADALLQPTVARMKTGDVADKVVAESLMCVREDALSFVDAVWARRGRTAYLTARAAFEGALNSALMVVGGEVVARQAWLHAAQKRVREVYWQRTIGAWRIGGRSLDEIQSLPQVVQAAINEFTSARGNEKNWRDDNPAQRIVDCCPRDEKAQFAWIMAFTGVYGTASEVVHGSYYGVQRSLGYDALLNHQAHDDPRPGQRQNHMLVLAHSVQLSLVELAVCLHLDDGDPEAVDRLRSEELSRMSADLEQYGDRDRDREHIAPPVQRVSMFAARTASDGGSSQAASGTDSLDSGGRKT